LILCGQSSGAALKGATAVIPEDIQLLAYPVLRIAFPCIFRAEAEQIPPDLIISNILEAHSIHERQSNLEIIRLKQPETGGQDHAASS